MHFFSASPLFSTHPVYSALARWSRLAISALVLPLFLLCSFHQKSFFLTVLVFVCLSLSGTHRHSHTHTPLFLSVYILYVVEADCLCNWVILLFTGLMHWDTHTRAHTYKACTQTHKHTQSLICGDVFLQIVAEVGEVQPCVPFYLGL